MGLPVHQILSALDDQMMGGEEEAEDEVVVEDEVEVGDEVAVEEAAEEDLVPDLTGVHVELVDSTHEGTKWLEMRRLEVVQVPIHHLNSGGR